ncbi:MAG: phosphoribosylformylglycinamidine synthase [Bacteroidales bacterium]|nr:phosphoribosylformylglycinamidine synthase [Bacteroidales bacterium]
MFCDMVIFFKSKSGSVVAVKCSEKLSDSDIKALKWLLGDARLLPGETVKGKFTGPRREMITPWSTTAVEITQNMNIRGIERMEEFFLTIYEKAPAMKDSGKGAVKECEMPGKRVKECEMPGKRANEGKNAEIPVYDKMLQRLYEGLDQEIFTVNKKPDKVVYIKNLASYNKKEGLALSKDEIAYLNALAKKIGRPLTDSEVFGFSQVNSEHCRHKIFNGTFIIDGKEMEMSLFQMIKKTTKLNPNLVVSAYKDNCAFLQGPKVKMFYPEKGDRPSFFKTKERETVISLKAETHNFPTTVEPFNGAATGTGGEIRDRMAGGKGSFPIAGTAVYMTSYPRFYEEESANAAYLTQSAKTAHSIQSAKATSSRTLDFDARSSAPVLRPWQKGQPRKWLYQSPEEILTKASNGASDFGNKFGQPIICGSVLTFEHAQKQKGTEKDNPKFGYDKVIMLAGGVGFAKKADAAKEVPCKGDRLVLLGGDNYRIGMGGGAVSSVNTGQYGNTIELNAIQRANAEMQKRDYNAIRALSEMDSNPIVSVHDHGAGGHLNCLSELVEETGGKVDISKLPIGDPTLSLKEIIGNESQERMGLALKQKDVALLKNIAERERAPFYEIGEVTDDHRFLLRDEKKGESAIDLQMSDMFGSAPKTFMEGETAEYRFNPLKFSASKFTDYLEKVLRLESVACKDWLTDKVDRSVTGLIALQQCCGEIQLPLNDMAVTAIGYDNKEGIATSLGHAPVAGLIDSAAGSRLSVAEALTNIVWAPLNDGLKGVSLSANWMWPSRNRGEDARLYKAVKAVSDFAVELGVNVPTGKDSMSMTQTYPDGEKVLAPGTVIISAAAPVEDVNNTVSPVLKDVKKSSIVFIPFSRTAPELGGSAFAQALGQIGDKAPDVDDAGYFKLCFDAVQHLVKERLILAGHDIGAGGLITSLLEMCFANRRGGIDLLCAGLPVTEFFFSERPGVVLQIADSKLRNVEKILEGFADKAHPEGVTAMQIGRYVPATKGKSSSANLKRYLNILGTYKIDIDKMRDVWYSTSYLMEMRQTNAACAKARATNFKKQPLEYKFPKGFDGKLSSCKTPTETLVKKKAAGAIKIHTPVAAIIREKGSNGDREMAWCLHLAGFRVKDVHMTDLTSGRENLKNVQMIVFVGGFSNADTLGSAKGWAGAFLYNEKANKALNDFYARKDTLSLGICNGCQLMAELGLITPNNRERSPKLLHNISRKFESGFVGVEVPRSSSILLKGLQGSKLGIWVAHGEGRFSFPAQHIERSSDGKTPDMDIALRYSYDKYPANPNGSPFGIAGVCSPDGRHLAMMPHPERCIRPWNWAYYPDSRKASDQVTPWIKMFTAAHQWCVENKK